MKRIGHLAFAVLIMVNLYACGERQASLTWQEQYDLGARYLSEGNYEEAIIAFTAAIEIDPQAESYIGRGQAYMLSGNTEDNLSAAIADFEAAIAIDNTLDEAWIGLVDIYIDRGKYLEAQNILKQAIEKIGDLPDFTERMEKIQSSIAASAINVLLAHEELWRDNLMTDWELWGKNFAYFMDLDIDGIPELVVETPMMGSGNFTYRTIYQVQGDDLIVVKNNAAEDSDWDDISLWQDRQTKEYFYIGYDNTRAGAEWYVNIWARLELKQGELAAKNLYVEDVSDGVTAYYGADHSTEITEAEFEQLHMELESSAENLGVQRGELIEEWDPSASQEEKRSILLTAYESAPLLCWVPSEQVTDAIFTRYEDYMYESAIIRGVDTAGIVRWNYTTERYELAQLERIGSIGVNDGLYYFNESGTITALDLQSGQVVWRNECGGVGIGESSYAFSEEGNLYFCGYFNPDFCAIGADGTTIKIIERLNEDYGWPYKMEVDGAQAIISFTMGPDGYNDETYYQFYVDLNNWSYGILGR